MYCLDNALDFKLSSFILPDKKQDSNDWRESQCTRQLWQSKDLKYPIPERRISGDAIMCLAARRWLNLIWYWHERAQLP